MNTLVTVTAVIKARPGQEAELRALLHTLVAPTRQEPGCLNYDLHEAADQPGTFLFHENWTSRAELDRHLAAPHVVPVLARVPELVCEPPQLTLWNRLA